MENVRRLTKVSTLREDLKFLDTIMNKMNKKEFYLILHQTLHNVWVIDIDGKTEPKEMPKHQINRAYIRVDPKVVKVLYGDNDETTNSNPDVSVNE